MLILMLILLNRSLSHMLLAKPNGVGGCYQGEEGSFFWTVKGDQLTLEIAGHITPSQWIGIGFSSDHQMGEDDVVAVLHTNERFQALPLFNSQGQSPTTLSPANSSIESSIVKYNGGEVKATIVKQISKSYPIDLRKPTYLFFGKGPINSVNPLTPIHRHTKNPSISRTPIDLHSFMSECISVRTNIFLKLHGIIMVILWLNLTIIAMFLARYAKYYFKQQSMWYTLHRNIGIFTGLLVLTSVLLAVAGVDGTFELERHQVVGLGVVALLLLHVWLAVFKPSKEQHYRTIWEYIHKTTALALHGFSFFNILSGLQMLKVYPACFLVVTIQVVYFCLLFIVMESPQHLRSFSNFINRHFGTAAYISVDTNIRYIGKGNLLDGEEQDSEFDDITMVTMDLDHPTTRLDYTQWGLYSLIGLNSISAILIGASIMMT